MTRRRLAPGGVVSPEQYSGAVSAEPQ